MSNLAYQYVLTCSKCQDSLVCQEKGEAIHTKIFHQMFTRHRVSLREEKIVLVEW